jgi:tetratricopeptide (TPR) repeat protein
MNTIDIATEAAAAKETQPAFHPNILLVHWEIYTRGHNWAAANNTALAIMNAMAAEPIGWIYRSFALHQLGRLSEAYANLLAASKRFPTDWRIPYNLASYASKLGDRAGAWNWLDRAIELGDADAIKSLALEDPIFRSFWQDLGKAELSPA